MPTFDPASNRYVRSRSVEVLPSAARTATGNGTGRVAGPAVLALTLDVTAASGTTPTLNVTVETSPDGIAWQTAGTFAQKTAVSSERKTFVVDKHVRVTFTIGGTTPSFTFSVAGDGS